MTEHLKMNAIYWGLSVLDLLDSLPNPEFIEKIKQFVLACHNPDGFFLLFPLHLVINYFPFQEDLEELLIMILICFTLRQQYKLQLFSAFWIVSIRML